MKKKIRTPETKICNRCKVKKPIFKNFTTKTIERVSGVKKWTHPWCHECRNMVKELWGTNWIGGKNNDNTNIRIIRAKGRKKKDTTAILRVPQRDRTKKVRGKRINKAVSERNNKRRRINSNRQKIRVPSTRKSRSIVKTLRKNKDYVGE